MDKKIRMLVIPSDHTGCGKFRSVDPHVYIGEHYKDEFDVDIVYSMPHGNLEEFFRQYDLVHIHKGLDKQGRVIDLIKFLGIPVIVDVDDNFKLGNDHPMSLTAKKERWDLPIITHLKKADCVTTTTPIYADILKNYNKNVCVFPNAIDPTEKQFCVEKTPSADGKLRVGIICGSSHLKDLELVRGVAAQIDKENVQFVLCGFDTRGTRTIYMKDGTSQTREIRPEESVWCEYEKIFTDNYKNISQEHKDFLMKFLKVDDPFVNEPYRRMWTRDISEYATHYANVDVLMAPLKENDFNKVKSELKEIECGFTHTAFIGQDFGPYTLNLKPMILKGGAIDEEGTALLVETSKNHKQWAKYINKLAKDRTMLKALQDNLFNFVKDKYTLEAICEERVKVYKDLVFNKK